MPTKRRPSRKHRQEVPHESLRVHLPGDYPWKVLRTLANDVSDGLTEKQLAYVLDITRKRDVERLGKLSEAWSPQCMAPQGYKPHVFAAKYQVAALLKKYRFPSDNSKRKAAALETFKAGESMCREFNAVHSKRLAYLTDDFELECFTYSKYFLSTLLGEYLPSRAELTEWSRHGPGANLDTRKRQTSMYAKYGNWPYSCTKDALELARLSIQDDERWLGALEDDYRTRMGIAPHLIIDQERFWADVLNVVPGNRIDFVPKNAKTDRSIAIEPAMNLYLQLGVDGFLRRRLKRYGVDLDCQEKNKELARVGSRDWQDENPFVTLDLKAASDTISLEVCRLLLPPQWFAYLMKLRSPVGVCDDETIVYEKISSMGNGYTFALESLLFFAIIYGVYRATHGTFDRNEVAVFGDDLIVRADIQKPVVTMLNRCGFSVNPEKSFIQGPFRESCGADWYRGIPVRPVFLDECPRTVMALWCDLNRIRRVQILRGWGYESSQVQTLMRRWIPDSFRGCQGPYSDEDLDSYEHVPLPLAEAKGGMYSYARLNVTFKRAGAENFLFRKLMHPLRQTDATPSLFHHVRWGGVKVKRLSGNGSRFAVYRDNAITVRKEYSQTSYWSDEYNEVLPAWKQAR